MSWLRVEGRMPQHKKVAPLSDTAFRLHVTAMAWCVEERTDGRVPINIPATLPAAPRGKILQKALDELVAAGLWIVVGDQTQWTIHDFLSYNPSAAQAAELASARALAGRTGGKRSASAKQSAKQLLEKNGSKPQANGQAKFNPDTDTQRSKEPLPRPGEISCPADLRLSLDQQKTLESAMLPAWGIDALTSRFVASFSADPDDKRTLVVWRKCLSQAISGWWNDPRKRPKEPEAAKPDELREGWA